MKRNIAAILLFLTLGVLSLLAGGLAVSAAQKETAAGAQASAKGGSGTGPMVPTGSAFTFQGQLKQNGTPADGVYDFLFTLYDDPSGGDQVGSTLNVDSQTVTGGYFTVALDFGPGAFNGQARWLEIAVQEVGGSEYTTLSPRQELSAAPYAMSLMPGAVVSGSLESSVLSVTNNGGGSGLYGYSDSGVGTTGESTVGWGLYGYSNSSYGVFGVSTASVGVEGVSQGAGGRGVVGIASNGTGVRGEGRSGVYGLSTANSGKGVEGIANTGSLSYGVFGSSAAGWGVYGEALGSDRAGVYGSGGDNSYGVRGLSTGSYAAVYGLSSGNPGRGVIGTADNGPDSRGVWGYSRDGYGLYGQSTGGGYAGYFSGRVHVNGTLSKSAGSFKIDHPLDPENKYLYHSFVESPDMMNIYNGNIILDGKGEAVVTMPSWFEALNKEFRYQLTTIGGYAPVYVAEEIQGNRFKIAGGKPGMKVSWLVTGIRHDPYAEENRIPVEENKPAEERGRYLHPELYGQPQSEAIGEKPLRDPDLRVTGTQRAPGGR